MITPADLPTRADAAVLGRFSLDSTDDDLGPYLFLQAHLARGDNHVVRRDLARAAPQSVLPERARILHTVDAGTCVDTVAEIDDLLVLLRTWRAAGDVWITGTDHDHALALVREIRSRLPQNTVKDRIEVRFTDLETGHRYLHVDVRRWETVRPLYAPDVQRAVDDLTVHRPTAAAGRRLVLWHGPPGTGKTTAIRALLHSWREWADGTIVTDPDELLKSGKYLRRTVLDAHDDDDRWQVLVLEDAESLLRKDSGAKGIAKLLNLADGLLGQGLRCLFLLTTNDPLGEVHAAVLRPGRCLANVHFGPLSPDQASAVLGQRVHRATTLAELLEAKPLAVKEEPISAGQYL